MEKKYPYDYLWCHHSIIMADFLVPEAQQSIIAKNIVYAEYAT